MFRRLTLAAALVASVVSTVPAHAAKTTKLYLVNVAPAGVGECEQQFALSTAPQDPDGSAECSGSLIGVDGVGLMPADPETFTSLRKLKFKVDVTRNLTGTLWFHHLAYHGLLTPLGSLPGYVEAEVVVKMDSVRIGTIAVEGVEMPKEGLKVNVNFRLPASLKNKTVSKITASVTWKTVVGLNGISFSDPYASFLNVPVK